MSEVLEVRGVTVAFGGVRAVADVSLTVGRGERVALIGPNGAGKTTLVNCVSGDLAPTEGSVWINGVNVSRRSPTRRSRMGLSRSFQNLELFDSMTVMDNLLTAIDAETSIWDVRQVLGARARRDRVMDMLGRFGIERFAGTPVAGLPYGVRKLVELSRAFVRNPRLLLLDEPVAGLSDTDRFLDLLVGVIEELGASLVLVEHDMTTVQRLCEQVYVLDSGRLIANGTYDQVSQDPRVVSAYLGASETS